MIPRYFKPLRNIQLQPSLHIACRKLPHYIHQSIDITPAVTAKDFLYANSYYCQVEHSRPHLIAIPDHLADYMNTPGS